MRRRAAAVRNEVSFLPKNRIDDEANLVLAEWAETRGEITAPPVPIDEIVELHLQLTLEFEDMSRLFPFGDVLGALWIQEQRVAVSHTLDPTDNPQRVGRYHFTLAHEAGHWRLHRQHYVENPYQGELFGDGPKPATVCRSSETKKPAEWQADCFAACLLMPRKLVRAAWEGWRGNLDVVGADQLRAGPPLQPSSKPAAVDDATPEKEDYRLMEEFCRPLATAFRVSREAMRIRLEELELLVRERPSTLF
jgi:hypothetical protein